MGEREHNDNLISYSPESPLLHRAQQLAQPIASDECAELIQHEKHKIARTVSAERFYFRQCVGKRLLPTGECFQGSATYFAALAPPLQRQLPEVERYFCRILEQFRS